MSASGGPSTLPMTAPHDPGTGDREVLVAYSTRFGSTAGVADRIAQALRRAGLPADVRLVGDLEEADAVDRYAAVVVGGPVFSGAWLPEADAFFARHGAALAHRPVWLFSVGSFGDRRRGIGRMMKREPRQIDAITQAVRPRDYRVFAGVIRREQWPLPARIFFHLCGGRLGDNRDWDEIERWAGAIAAEIG